MNGKITLSNKLKGAVTMANTIINGGASPYPKGASGDIITITDGAENTPLKSAVVNIEPAQSGSGDPSPTNIRPISGWTQAKVWVKPTYDTTLTPTATIPLGQTVYGGTLDVVRGKLVVTKIYVTLDGSENVGFYRSNGSTTYNCFQTNLLSKFGVAVKEAWGGDSRKSAISTAYIADGNVAYAHSGNAFAISTQLIIVSTNQANSVAGFKAYLASNPVGICATLAAPIEVDLTPQTIKTLLGTNNIWADAGEMSIEYYPAAASIVAVQNRSTKAYVSIPLGMIRYETYQITPQQTIDLDSYRSENGNLLRNPVATKCKLEFNTPLMTDTQWGEIWNIIKAGFNNNTERKLKLKYYDTLSATYKTGYFYVPDVQTTIRNIEEGPGVINYQEIRLAFIEY